MPPGRWLKRAIRGFTLAELLIALTVLGVIASFTIPKVLTQMNKQQSDAVLKETVSAMMAIAREGVLRGELSNMNNGSYIRNKLNVIRICSIHSRNEGCAPPTEMGTTIDEWDEPGAVLARIFHKF